MMLKAITAGITIAGLVSTAFLLRPQQPKKVKITVKPTAIPITVNKKEPENNNPISLPEDQQKIFIVEDKGDGKFTNKVGVFEGLETPYGDGTVKGRVRVGSEYTTLDKLSYVLITESLQKDPAELAMVVGAYRGRKATQKLEKEGKPIWINQYGPMFN